MSEIRKIRVNDVVEVLPRHVLLLPAPRVVPIQYGSQGVFGPTGVHVRVPRILGPGLNYVPVFRPVPTLPGVTGPTSGTRPYPDGCSQGIGPSFDEIPGPGSFLSEWYGKSHRGRTTGETHHGDTLVYL